MEREQLSVMGGAMDLLLALEVELMRRLID